MQTQSLQTVSSGAELASGLDSFAQEVQTVYETLVKPHAGRGRQGCPHLLHSFTSGLFARLDLLSAYWQGTEQDRMARITEFMNTYLPYNPEAHSVAAQLWGCPVLTAGEPHGLYHNGTGRSYLWVLYWGEELPPEQHFQFHDASHSRILSLGLLPLLADIRQALHGYLIDLAWSETLQSNWEATETRRSTHRYRPLRE
jgi:hypothetical protein